MGREIITPSPPIQISNSSPNNQCLQEGKDSIQLKCKDGSECSQQARQNTIVTKTQPSAVVLLLLMVSNIGKSIQSEGRGRRNDGRNGKNLN